MANEEFEEQFAKTNKQMERLMQAHAELKQFIIGFIEETRELNQSLREMTRALTISQARTDERLDNLARGSS